MCQREKKKRRTRTVAKGSSLSSCGAGFESISNASCKDAGNARSAKKEKTALPGRPAEVSREKECKRKAVAGRISLALKEWYAPGLEKGLKKARGKESRKKKKDAIRAGRT